MKGHLFWYLPIHYEATSDVNLGGAERDRADKVGGRSVDRLGVPRYRRDAEINEEGTAIRTDEYVILE